MNTLMLKTFMATKLTAGQQIWTVSGILGCHQSIYCFSLQLGYTLQQLRFAQASAPAAPSLDWDALDELVTSEEGKRELGALRTAYFNLQDQSAEGTQVIFAYL